MGRKKDADKGTQQVTPCSTHISFPPLPHSQCNLPATAHILTLPRSLGPGSLAFDPWACVYVIISSQLSMPALSHPVAKMKQPHSLTKTWACQPQILRGPGKQMLQLQETPFLAIVF